MDANNNYDQPLYPISVAAKILNVSVHTLRMYEREGLIVPFKKESSHRLYSQSDIDRLKCIRKAINELKISINGIKALYSLIPCWNLTDCPEEIRNSCRAFTSHSEPCWSFNSKDQNCVKECRECDVYRNYTDCEIIKKSIVEITTKR